MAVIRLVSLLLAVLVSGLLVAPVAGAQAPFRLPTQVTDRAGVLSAAEVADVEAAVDKLYDDRRIQLWVVYVADFSGRSANSWAQETMKQSGLGSNVALLAVATQDREYAFEVRDDAAGRADQIRRDNIEPALRDNDWSGAAIAAAQGLGSGGSGGLSALTLVVTLAVLVLVVASLWFWSRRRRGKRRRAEFEAAKRVDPTDPNALAGVPLDALDELSKSIVVDVDNAVRTSEGELSLAVDEFGVDRTEPFARAVANAKTALAQAFNVRQVLDDAVPETPLQRRDLLTRSVVAAAKADRELDAQSEAFEALRDLVINAAGRLDTMTQQLVDLTARMDPAAQELDALHQQYSATALASVTGNVAAAKERLAFADRNITAARSLAARPVGSQDGLVDAIRAAESALGQARTLLEAVDSASADINRATAGLPGALADIQTGIAQAGGLLAQPDVPQAGDLAAARDAATAAVSEAQASGQADPLGAFTRLTSADADLDRLLASVHEQREAADRLARALDQAMFTAQSRVKAVSDFIDTRRGSIGPEARTRLAEANRHLQAAEAKRAGNPGEAIAHANGAAMLAAQAQSLANDDVRAAQRSYHGGGGAGGSDLGAVIGGIIIGNVLRGGFGGGGWGGGYSGGRSAGRPASYGGSSRSSGRSYSGGGRF